MIMILDLLPTTALAAGGGAPDIKYLRTYSGIDYDSPNWTKRTYLHVFQVNYLRL